MCDAEFIVSQSRNPKSEHGYDANTALHAMIAAALDAKDATIADLREQVEMLTKTINVAERIAKGENVSHPQPHHFLWSWCSAARQSMAQFNRDRETAESELSRAREAMKYLAEMYYKRVLMGFDSDYQHDEIANMLNTTAAEAVMEARKANPLAAAAVKENA